jgi:hypothetical protein
MGLRGLDKDRNRWRALVNLVLNLQVPRNAGKLSNGLTTSGLSSSAQLHRVTNTLIKTTVRNKYLFVLDFIVHYYNMFRPRSVAIFR